MISEIITKDVCQASNNLEPESLTPIRIKLYKKTSQVYKTLHENRDFSNATEEYSKVLRDYMDELWMYHHPSYVREREMCAEIISVWQLFEILYFSRNTDTKTTIKTLMDWLYNTFKASCRSYDLESILHHGLTINHHDFWPYCFRLVIFGKSKLLHQLIKHVLLQITTHHPNLVPIFTAIDQYNMDRIAPNYEELIELRKDEATKKHAHNALQLIALLKGDVNVIFQYVQNNIEAIITSLYYNMEMVDSIQAYTHRIMQKRETQPSPHYYLLTGDVYRALEQSTSMDWWLLAHMSDILDAHHMIDKKVMFLNQHNEEKELDAKEYFVSYYASCLFRQYGLTREALYYLSKCGKIGKEIIIYFIEEWGYVDEASMDEIMAICIKLSLMKHGLKLYGKVADQYMTSKDYIKAIEYYYRAEQYEKIETVFSAILKEYTVSGHLISMDDLNSRYQGVRTGPCSEIYYKLLDYTKLKNDDFKGLTKQYLSLVSTITEDDTPNWIKPILYLKGMKLLEDEPFHFDLLQLLYLKKLWKDLKNTMEMNDYKWLVYYLRKETGHPTDLQKVQITDEDSGLLSNAMAIFFDTTAIYISQAIERVKNK